MKKILYSLVAVSFLSLSAHSTGINEIMNTSVHFEVLAPQVTTTDIFNYLKTNLNLTSAQQPTVQQAVTDAGTEFTKLNKSSDTGLTKDAKTTVFNEFIKKITSGSLLSSAQSTKLTSLAPNLQTMFSQLK